jgi:hypothetical protein
MFDFPDLEFQRACTDIRSGVVEELERGISTLYQLYHTPNTLRSLP